MWQISIQHTETWVDKQQVKLPAVMIQSGPCLVCAGQLAVRAPLEIEAGYSMLFSYHVKSESKKSLSKKSSSEKDLFSYGKKFWPNC